MNTFLCQRHIYPIRLGYQKIWIMWNKIRNITKLIISRNKRWPKRCKERSDSSTSVYYKRIFFAPLSVSSLVIKKIDAACVDERGAKKEATAPASMLAPLFIKRELSSHLYVTILMLLALAKEVQRKKRQQHLCLLKKNFLCTSVCVVVGNKKDWCRMRWRKRCKERSNCTSIHVSTSIY